MSTKKSTRSPASLKISNDVLTKIAEVAATEIRGVAAQGEHLAVCDKGVGIANKFISPVKVIVRNEAAEISVNIVVLQGFKANEVAESVQKSIKSAVQNMAGVPVSKVNVRIADIMLNSAGN
ncbi:MAG: Asp23/Gls24 family envelope stress response protein [Eubacterium sp.]|nr:Asp23/Gls24 family envelope stress response protein [Eubacterium sp.]